MLKHKEFLFLKTHGLNLRKNKNNSSTFSELSVCCSKHYMKLRHLVKE